MARIFVTADLHFGHANIIKYCNRPFSTTEEMDETLIKNWNQVVSKQDKVFIVGDFSFHDKEKTTEIISRLNGHKVLIYGNHDKSRNIQWWYEVGMNEVSKYTILYKEWLVLQHEPPTFINDSTPYFYIYGHVHNTPTYKTLTNKSCCVSVERWGYTPVDLDKINDLIKLL